MIKIKKKKRSERVKSKQFQEQYCELGGYEPISSLYVGKNLVFIILNNGRSIAKSFLIQHLILEGVPPEMIVEGKHYRRLKITPGENEPSKK